MRLLPILASILLGTFFLGACATTSNPTPATPEAPPAITWRDWSLAVFDEARRDERMVLLDVGIEGCTACRWMFEDTYRHPEVVRRVRAHFVPVAVDANVHPDLGERFARWGWPATIVFDAEGTQILALRGNKRPRNFLPILDELIARHADGRLEADADLPLAAVAAPDETWPAGVCRELNDALAPRPASGFSVIRGAPIDLAFLRGWTRDDESLRHHALATAERWSTFLDPVWGGVFVAGSDERLIVEKRTRSNAAALRAFAHAYALTGDDLWLGHAHAVDRYMRGMMRAPSGAFYTTQEDDAPDLGELDARAYYALDDAGRRARGIPPIDRAIYADLNGQMISAYVVAHEASREPTFLEAATEAAEAMSSLLHEDGWIAHAAPGGSNDDSRMRAFRPEPRPYLGAQAWMGLAFLDLYRATGASAWLDRARRLADASLRLLAAEDGGFHDAPEADPVLGPRIPVEANAVMARMLLQLASAARDERYQQAAERTLRAIAGGAAERGRSVAAEVGLALEWLTVGPLEMSIVAEPGDPAARPLLEAAQGLWEPRKIIHFEPDGRYPRQERPVLHVCTRDACSSPIEDPAALAETLAGFRHADGAPCE